MDPLVRLRELFSGYDDEFLRSVYMQSGQNLQRAVDHLLDFSRTHGGASNPSYPGTPDNGPSSLGLLSQAALMSKTEQPSANGQAHPMAPNVIEMKKQQLQQVQRYLYSKGLPTMTPTERKQFLTANPAAIAELKQFLTSIGLGQYNFAQLQQYFKDSGLTLALPGGPAPQTPRDPLIRQLLAVEGRNYDQYMFSNMLSPAQKQQFRELGFVLVANVVPRQLIDAALRDINRSLRSWTAREHGIVGMQPMSSAPVLDLLYQSPVLAYAMSLTGPVARVNEALIDLSFPGMGCIDRMDERYAAHVPPNALWNHFVPDPQWQRNWQIDDMHYPQRGQARNYTLLVAVLLSDMQQPLIGNPTIFPRTHHAFQEVMQQAGGAQRFLEQHGIEELRRLIPTQDGVQVAGAAGDVLLMHYAAAHTIAPNVGSHIRYMACFRLYQASHVPGVFRPEAMDRIWLEFDGLHDLRPAVPAHVSAVARQCSRCGQRTMDAIARFCQYCGNALAPGAGNVVSSGVNNAMMQ